MVITMEIKTVDMNDDDLPKLKKPMNRPVRVKKIC